jgi:GNAT superfamily N-acetyltransferase
MGSPLQQPSMLTKIDQDRVNALARAVEPCAIAAWPARETLEMGGWLLRFSDGYSHRGNSVAALGFEGGDLLAHIAVAEMAYYARDLTPLFQITPLTQPANLEQTLIARGYLCDTPTNVMIADAASLHRADDVTLTKEPDASFKALVVSGSHSVADGDERIDVLSRINSPRIFAGISESGKIIACGMCTAMGGWGGINLMRTHSDYRRKGYAARILGALAHWADEQGAAQLYLQVEEVNAPARALYAKAGFADAYSYRFYRAP